MATKEQVVKVWIEEGCIVCDACETTAPDVFDVTDDTCLIRPEALKPDFTKPRTEAIVDAAEECPVDVIKFEVVASETADEEPAAAPQPAAATVEVKDEAAPAAPEKSPEAPAEPAKAAAAEKPKPAEPKAQPSDDVVPDPSIQALLQAAKARGGSAGILKRSGSTSALADAWDRKDPSELPPEAKQARAMEHARKAAKDPSVGRREFVGGAALAVGWTAFGLGVGVSVGPAFGRFMMPNVLEEPDPRIRVGKLPKYVELAPGQVNEDFKPQGIWMIREEGRIAALSIICTHLGCIPNWLPNDRKFKCPCHGSGYLPNGINFEGPTPRPLERFRIYIEDGEVIVDKSKKYQYELGQWTMPGSYIEV